MQIQKMKAIDKIILLVVTIFYHAREYNIIGEANMTVYADILILINTYVNFFILLATSALLRLKRPFWSLLIGAVAGGLCSLVILIPQRSELLSCLAQLIIASLVVLLSFGFSDFRTVVKRLALFFAASFIFSGCVYCYSLAFKPDKLIINNSVIYFDISALELIIASAVIYLLVIIVRIINGGYCKKERQTVELVLNYRGKTVEYTCLLDTGNMLRDSFTDTPVAVVDSDLSQKLGIDFSNPDSEQIREHKIRFIPFGTVAEKGLMPVFRPDKITVNGKEANNLLIGVSSHKFGGEYNAVANYDII